MTQPAAVLVGAVIGALVALSGSILTNVIAWVNEGRKQKEARRVIYSQALRDQFAQVFKQLFEIVHSVEWVAAHAGVAPQAITPEMIKNYDVEVHKAYSELSGALAVLAALNLDAYKRIKPLSDELTNLEFRTVSTLLQVKNNNSLDQDAITKLNSYVENAIELRNRLPLVLANTMREPETYIVEETQNRGS